MSVRAPAFTDEKEPDDCCTVERAYGSWFFQVLNMEDKTDFSQDVRVPLAGWLLVAMSLHLLALSKLSLDFDTVQPSSSDANPVIKVILRRVVTPESALVPAQLAAPVAELVNKAKEEPALLGQQLDRTVNESLSESSYRSKQKPPETEEKASTVDVNRLKEAIRAYRLPEHDGESEFSPVLPKNLDPQVFRDNGLMRINQRIQAYDNRGGARVLRKQVFGGKDRCFLLHRTGFEIEREDWDPAPELIVGWGAEEIECE